MRPSRGAQPFVSGLATYDGALFAGGYFDSAGNVPASNIAKYTGFAGINEAMGSINVNIYPNPCRDKITLQKSGDVRISAISLYNILGELAWQCINVVNENTEIPVGSFGTGIYFVKIQLSDNSILVKKIEVIK